MAVRRSCWCGHRGQRSVPTVLQSMGHQETQGAWVEVWELSQGAGEMRLQAGHGQVGAQQRWQPPGVPMGVPQTPPHRAWALCRAVMDL